MLFFFFLSYWHRFFFLLGLPWKQSSEKWKNKKVLFVGKNNFDAITWELWGSPHVEEPTFRVSNLFSTHWKLGKAKSKTKKYVPGVWLRDESNSGRFDVERPGFKASFISPSYLIWGKHLPSGSLPFSLWVTTLYTEQGSLEGLSKMWHVKDYHGVWHKRRPSVKGNFYHYYYYYSDSDWIWGNCWWVGGG